MFYSRLRTTTSITHPVAFRRRPCGGLVALLCVPFAAGCLWNGGSSHSPLLLSGTVEAREVDLSFQVGGRLAQLHTDEGKWIEQGAPVAELDRHDFELEWQRASATADAAKAELDALKTGTRVQELRVAEADLQKARSQLNYSSAEVKRYSSLIPRKLASEEQLEQAQLRYEESMAGVEQAKQRLNLLKEGPRGEDILRAEAQYNALLQAAEIAKRRLDYTRILSPVAGMVTVRMSEAGEVVSPGVTVMRVTQITKPWVRAYLSEKNLSMVRLGQKVQVIVDNVPAKSFTGILTFISPVAEFTPKTVETRELRVDLVYRIKVEVENPHGELKVGMPADVSVPVTGNE